MFMCSLMIKLPISGSRVPHWSNKTKLGQCAHQRRNGEAEKSVQRSTKQAFRASIQGF